MMTTMVMTRTMVAVVIGRSRDGTARNGEREPIDDGHGHDHDSFLRPRGEKMIPLLRSQLAFSDVIRRRRVLRVDGSVGEREREGERERKRGGGREI